MKKKCPKCGEVKSLTDFYKDKTSKDGHHVHCINCILLSINKRGKTEEGFLRRRYNNILQAHKHFKGDKKRAHQCYFTFEEFLAAWEKHKSIYGMRSAWGPHHLPITMTHQVREGLGKGCKNRGLTQIQCKSNLSAHRLDSSKPYTIQNLIFIRNDENNRKKDTSYEDCKIQMRLHEERFINMESI